MASKTDGISLVVRPEKLGDLVVSTPVFQALKESFPSSPVHLVTDSIFAEAVKHDPHIDKIIELKWRGRNRPARESWWSIYHKLKGQKYDRAALLYYNQNAWNWMMAALGVKIVAQLGGTQSALLFGHKMVLRKNHGVRRHFSQLYLEVAKELAATTSDEFPHLYMSDKERENFLSRFPEIQDNVRHIIIHPFGHGSSPNLSLRNYRELASQLSVYSECRVYITGSATEAAKWDFDKLKGVSTVWLGQLTLREWIVASSLVDLVIAGSTGVIHAAAAVGTKTLGVYCPFVGSHPSIWGPKGRFSTNLVAPDTYCKKIGPSASQCSGDNCCDLGGSISPSVIASQAMALITNPHASVKTR